MFNTDDVSRIKNTVSSLTKQTSGDVEVNYGEGLHVTLDNGRAVITAEDKNAIARGFFMLSKAIAQKQDKLDLHQARHFSSCGAMIDMSRNAVMTVNAVKGVIDKMAALGMNLLMLYTEDTYTVPGYPYLGYLRGRYSRADLTEIDAYAASFDIEVVPCIQTLGHMEQFLQWSANSAMEDQPAILLAGAKETYDFIEAAVSELRSCMRAKRIHIGMDEAHGVGLGQYYIKNGARDRFEILNSHLARVCEICKKHDFHPIMWSDMFFRLGSKNNDYFDLEADIPESVIKMIPDVDLCYWDYYHTDEALYNHMMEQHAKMGKTVFAGGIWTWSGFLPHVKRTEATMIPALKACIRHSVDTVFATMWGDDGAETDFCLAFNQLPLFSEFCWQGEAATIDEIRETGAFLTGISAEDYKTFGEFYLNEMEYCSGKGLIWCDPLHPMMEYGFESMGGAAERYKKAANALTESGDSLECRYAVSCFITAAQKGEMIEHLRGRYLAGDKEYLRRVSEQLIPELQESYQKLMEVHRQLWERDMKRFGWEVLVLRYGGAIARLADVKDELDRYLNGMLSSIPELEEEPLHMSRRAGQHYQGFATPMYYL